MPAAAKSCTSVTTCPNGRLISGPRTAGTMQKAHWLSQPIWMVTHAAQAWSRRTGRADGKASSPSGAASRISNAGTPVAAAEASRSPACPTLWVPHTASTHGARRWMASWSFWARQPPTAICTPGRRSLMALRWPRCPYSLLSAFSRMQQVLRTMTSAASARSVATRPSPSRMPARRSESCSFIWQPKVRMK